MVYLFLDPRLYFPDVPDKEALVTWFGDICHKIIKNRYSVKIIILKHMEYGYCESSKANILRTNYVKQLLLMLEQNNVFTYVYYIENLQDMCDDLSLTPDIFQGLDDNTKQYFKNALCESFNRFKVLNILSFYDDENNITKQCMCNNYNEFKKVSSFNVIHSIDPFSQIFNIYKVETKIKINYNLSSREIIDSIRKNMINWYKERHYKIEDNNYIDFEITTNFIEDLKNNNNVINNERLIGSMVRILIAPGDENSKKCHKYVIDCHDNNTKINKSRLSAEGESFKIKRAYVLEENEHTRGNRMNRIIFTKYNDQVIFLNYVHNHDITDNQIKKSLKSYLNDNK